MKRNDDWEIFKYLKDGDIERIDMPESLKESDIPLCKKTHNFYQWVPFLFVFQGFLFIIPHKIWRGLEEGKMSSISNGVTLANQQKEEDRMNMVKNIARFVDRETGLYNHKKYAYGYLFCQFLNLINVVFNIWLLDTFIEGHFLDLGWKWINGGVNDRFLKNIFPRMTLCDWNTFGTAGHVQSTQYMCLLATNIVTEKVFVFLWFWLLILLILSSGVILYYCMMLFSRSNQMRNYLLAFTVRVRVSKLRIRETDEKDKGNVVKYLRALPSTNFFFLYMLASNVDYRCLQYLLRELQQRRVQANR